MDVEQILTVLQDHNLIRLNRPMGKYYSIYCPIHKGGNEHKPSCGVLLQDDYRNGQLTQAGFVHCFTCHYAKYLPDMITDILSMRNISKSGLDWLVENVPGFSPDSVEFDYLLPSVVSKQLLNKYALSTIHPKTPTYVSEKELQSYRFCVDYMYQRGLTDDIISKYDVGVDLNFVPKGKIKPVPCITFPVRDILGHTLFICRRSIEGKAFYLPEDVMKPVYGLYELPKNCNVVLITESCFNTLTSVKYGIPSVSLLGTGTPYQYKQLKQLGVSEFVLGLDPDNAGDIGSKRLKRELKSISIVRRMVGIPSGKDINDLSYEEFYELFNHRV